MTEHTKNLWQEIFQTKGDSPWEDPETLTFKQYKKSEVVYEEIKLEELTDAIQKSKSFKTPGKSRLGAEIYKHC